jgi:hypothetical protein
VAHGVPARAAASSCCPRTGRVVRSSTWPAWRGRRAPWPVSTPNNTREQCHYIAGTAEAVVAGGRQPAGACDVWKPEGSRPAGLSTIVLLEGKAEDPGVVGWEEFPGGGGASHETEVARRRAALTGRLADDAHLHVGTTGTPKGVMLTQRNLAFIARGSRSWCRSAPGTR